MELNIPAFSLLAAAAVLALAAGPLCAQTSQDNSVNRAGLTNAATAGVTLPPATAAPAVHNEAPEPSYRPTEESDSEGVLSSALGKLIPIVAIVMGCSIPILIVTAVWTVARGGGAGARLPARHG